MIEFKNEEARSTYPQLDERLKDAVFFCSQWCDKNKIPFVITRCIDGMIPNVSKTDIHSTGRACDVSIKGWTADNIDDFIHDINERFSNEIGAFSITDNVARFCIYHCGIGFHMHLQVRP